MGQIGRVSTSKPALDALRRLPMGRFDRYAMRIAEDRVLARTREQKFRIALCVPMGGSDGIWGPSCLASARLAEAELNRFDGIAGRACELVPMDASNTAEGIAPFRWPSRTQYLKNERSAASFRAMELF